MPFAEIRQTPVGDKFSDERAELEAVLASELISRSPNLTLALRYVCEKYFSGEAGSIKEYNIAVEAFGRPPGFDPRRDSIVRVEISRLRRRLDQFYEEDRDRRLRISIPSGSYVPEFTRRNEALPEVPLRVVHVAPAEEPVWLRLPIVAALAVLLLAVVLIAIAFRDRFSFAAEPSAKPGPVAGATAAVWPGDEVRILCGSAATKFVDRYGDTWSGDRYFTGGRPGGVPPRPIANTRDPGIYFHWRQGAFSYDMPLKPGSYELRLHFAEAVYGDNNDLGGGESSRLFTVRANGRAVLDRFDILSDAGGTNTANIKVFKDIQPANDGKLHLEFVSNREAPLVNAIEILPSRPGAIRPIRILARDSNYTDSEDRVWSGDRFFHSGTLVQRHDTIKGTAEPPLYQGERFGNFSYTIPVAADSKYKITLRFCEYWFGRDNIGGGDGGVGSRVFDVYLNGRTLLQNFDVFRKAGSRVAHDETFRGIEPNAQGKLIFHFVPKRNYAMINAFEIIDERWK